MVNWLWICIHCFDTSVLMFCAIKLAVLLYLASVGSYVGYPVRIMCTPNNK